MTTPINTSNRDTFWLPTLDDPPFQVYLVEQDPTGWRMIAGCILLGQVHRGQVGKKVEILFERWPNAERMAAASTRSSEYTELLELVSPLGSQFRRAKQVVEFSDQWLEHEEWKNSTKLWRFAGCSWYAAEAWRIFIDRDCATEPQDYVLHRWAKTYAGIRNRKLRNR